MIGDAQYIVWLVLLAAALHFTPTGRALSPRWHAAMVTTAVAGAMWFAMKMVHSVPLNDPFAGVRNPWARRFPTVLDGLYFLTVMVANAGVVVGAVSLFVRIRRSRGDERRQLQWMFLVAIVFPLLILATFAAALTDHQAIVNITAGLFVFIVPVAAGASVLRFRLYDVDRILSRAATYVLVSLVLGAVFVTLAVGLGQLLGSVDSESRAGGLVASVATVAIAAPVHRFVQRALDRRFNRRRFSATNLVREYLKEPSPQTGIEQLFQLALGDPNLHIAYWVDGSQWVASSGQRTEVDDQDLVVQRHSRPVACVHFDHSIVETELVHTVANQAIAELDNVALRAAVALQLVEVRESRARIVAAHLSERHRLERNLHDGAQQRLLGLAFELRAAELSRDGERLSSAVCTAIDQLRVAVEELRDLANGLHPQMLSDGGLAATMEDLASRTPVPLHIHATPDRFAPDVEAAIWFVACEAITNAVKHAHPSCVDVRVEHCGEEVRLVVEDDGVGGADPTGRGLQGIADRAEAAGGRLAVSARLPRGTTISVELPCAS